MIPYILHVALLLSVCLLFYKLLLQKETFYRLNRMVLVCCLALAFVLPLVPIPAQWSFQAATKQAEVNYKPLVVQEQSVVSPQSHKVATPSVPTPPSVSPSVAPTQTQAVPAPIENIQKPVQQAAASTPILPVVLKWLFYLYWMGVAAFGLNLLLQFIVLLFQAYTKPFIRDGKFRIVELSGDKAPCSFGNNIFINPEKYDWDTYSQILLHEKIHIAQRHSFDIIMSEVMLVLQWFNPFAWLYRKEVENNLEFLTDDSVLEHKEVERQSYQMSLLKVSAPHLSLGITTNYNQSLLKRRILMMNAKKSNIHTMWKYFFLVPLLGGLACALNSPLATASAEPATKVNPMVKINPVVTPNVKIHFGNDETEGAWFATIKGDKVRIEFKSDDEDHNWSSSSEFNLSDFSALPKDKKGDFTLKREAGSILFTGRFEGNDGYGHYKFTADKDFVAYLKSQGINDIEDGDSFAFFVINVTKEYLGMLQRNGYKDITKENLISMAALKVDEPYIKALKENGYNDLSVNDLVSGKALHVTPGYIQEIHNAGYKSISFNELISFKAQHIDGKYIAGIKKAKLKGDNDEGDDHMPSPEAISSYKAMNIDSNYVHSLAAVGYKNIPYNELTSLKALNITPAFIKSFKDIGYTNLSVNNLTELKSLGITPAYIQSYKAMGFKDLTVNNLTNLKAVGVTPEYIKSMEASGLKGLSVNHLSNMKAVGVTPEYIKSMHDIGFKDLTANGVESMRAVGVTPEYVKGLQQMGFKDLTANGVENMKAVGVTPEYVKSMQEMGLKDLTLNNISNLKAIGVTPDFVKEFEAIGYHNLTANNLNELKAMGITPDFVKEFEAIGFKDMSVNNLNELKAMGITPEYVKGFRDIGFKDVTINQLSSAKAQGVTPQYVTEMRNKGFNSDDLEKYIRLKNAFN
ncbi:MAG TPA: M56 family metallopeptidase [Mucilaginibacter sp.]|jgi:hypothetical protein|nr:M56 family metallopeptidase [Mucilaginibacter sp.]